MKVAVFSAKPYDRQYLSQANAGRHALTFLEPGLDAATCPLAAGHAAVCAFVNDVLDRAVLLELKRLGVGLLAMRCAGYNNVDLTAAREAGLVIARVPAYSPFAVAEHTVALMLALNRKIYRAVNRVRERNFSLDGLLGFDMRGKTAGIVGTGQIGAVVAEILKGFGCRLVAYDIRPNPGCEALGAVYLSLEQLFAEADVISLHCPLLPQTRHLISADTIARMKTGVMLINTSRGGLVDTRAVIEGLKSGKIAYLGLDVYEEEGGLFFEDKSNELLIDDVFARLLTFPNVIITGHQAFFTHEALVNIAATTVANLTAFEQGERNGNEVPLEPARS